MSTTAPFLSFLVGAGLILPAMPIAAGEPLELRSRVSGDTEFGLSLYGQLPDASGNVFLSPHSISTALAMTWAGARGETARQMASALHLTGDGSAVHAASSNLAGRLAAIGEKGAVQLAVANSLWPQQGYAFLPEYLELARRYYGVTITPVDFARAPAAACKTINDWVEERTQRRIQDLLSPDMVDPLTRLVLVNAVYFKGRWEHPFPERGTRPGPFHRVSGAEVEAPFMHLRAAFPYAEDGDAQALELPYAGGELSMVILLPRQPDGLAGLEQRLDAASLAGWTNRLRRQEVDVAFPRFRLTSTFRLERTLQALGMRDAFDPRRADFTGMDGQPHGLYVGAAVHKAFVEVNEEGTEAAAATGLTVRLTSIAPPAPVFRADHPFLFLIRERATGCLLFLGRLTDPKG
jgi:serpin B